MTTIDFVKQLNVASRATMRAYIVRLLDALNPDIDLECARLALAKATAEYEEIDARIQRIHCALLSIAEQPPLADPNQRAGRERFVAGLQLDHAVALQQSLRAEKEHRAAIDAFVLQLTRCCPRAA